MNANQKAIYGDLPTTADHCRRHCVCPVCGERFSVSRHGRGPARAVASLLRGMVMRHLRERHPEELSVPLDSVRECAE